LSSPDALIQYSAAGALRNLAVHPENDALIVGGIAPLIVLLSSSVAELYALSNLGANVEHKIAIATAEGIPRTAGVAGARRTGACCVSTEQPERE
jgi:hypothetical protein